MPVLPVATLNPAGFDSTCSPLRPPALTDSEIVVGATTGFSVKVAERVTPPPETEIVASVCVLTAAALIKNPPVVLPAGIVTEIAVSEAAALLLLIWKIWSVAEGAAMVTVAKELVIPLTEAGLRDIDAG